MKNNPGIHLEHIAVDCHIGPEADERAILQRIVVSLFLAIDLTAAAMADDISLTIDYRAVAELAIAEAIAAPLRTLEGLAFHIGRQILSHFPLADDVTIEVQKPGVPGRADRVCVVLQIPR